MFSSFTIYTIQLLHVFRDGVMFLYDTIILFLIINIGHWRITCNETDALEHFSAFANYIKWTFTIPL